MMRRHLKNNCQNNSTLLTQSTIKGFQYDKQYLQKLPYSIFFLNLLVHLPQIRMLHIYYKPSSPMSHHSENEIIIIPESLKTSTEEYARVSPGAEGMDDDLSPPGMVSHNELVKLKHNAEHKRRAARRKKAMLGAIVILAIAFLAVILYSSAILVMSAEPPINDQSENKQGTGNEQTSAPSVNQNTATSKPTPAAPAVPVPNATLPAAKPERRPQLIPLDVPAVQINPFEHRPVTEHSGHKPLTLPYPTLGMPTVNTPFNSTEVPMGDSYYQYEKAMDELFKPYNDTNCAIARFGDLRDGGYLLCTNLMEQSEGLINLGVEGRDLFGCGVSSEFMIPNYQYDCTNNIAPNCVTNKELNRFESACLAAETERAGAMTYYALQDMIRMRNLTGRHVSMKIDVEGAEWPGLRTFPVADLKWVDQIVLEIHLRGPGIGHPQVWGNLDTIRSLSKEFVSVSLHMNNYACINDQKRFYPSFAIEVTLVNRRLIKINNPTRSYALHSQDRPNREGGITIDCQLRD